MKASVLRIPFLVGVATTLVVGMAQATRVSSSPTSTGVAPVSNGVMISGSTFKHNVTSEMRVNLNLIGADTENGGVQAGYGVYGDTLVDRIDGRGEHVKIHFPNISFKKLGTIDTTSRPQRTDTAQPGQPAPTPITKDYDNYGSIDLTGRKIGTRATVDLESNGASEIVLAGTKLSGSFRNENAGSTFRSGNAINFSGLVVNGQPSAGRMNYFHFFSNSDNGGYAAENNLHFGRYTISNSLSSSNDVDNTFMSYLKSSNAMTINMNFGDLVVSGTIQYVDKTETQLQQYAVQVQDPFTSMMIQQQRNRIQNRQISNMFGGRRSSLGQMMMDQAHSQMLNNLEQSSTHTEIRTTSTTSIVATEGRYSLRITARDGHPLSISKDVGNISSDTEEELRALLAFLMSINYDISSEE